MGETTGTIATVNQVEAFRIIHIGSERVGQILSEANPPHRHSYQEVIFVSKGEVRHQLDDILERIPSPAAIVVPQFRVHQLVPSRDFEATALRFHEEFLPQGVPLLFGNAVPLLHCHLNPVRELQVQKLLEIMQDEEHGPNTLRWLLLATLSLLQEWQPHSHVVGEQEGSGSDLQKWRLLEQTIEGHFHTDLPIRGFAELVRLNEKGVNQLAKRFSGKTIGELIDARRILEAKRLLLYSSENLKEIAFRVGYIDHSYFTRVFKKITRVTPSEFRQ